MHCIARDKKLFVGWDHERMQGRIVRSDLLFQSDRFFIAVLVQLQSSPLEALADSLTDRWRIFSNPSREDNCISTAHAGEKRPNVLPGTIAKDLYRNPNSAVVMVL